MSYGSFKLLPLAFGLAYLASFYLGSSPFFYYPETRAFYWTAHPDDGPAIMWYGWLANGAVAGLAVTALLPRRIADRVPDVFGWLTPILLVLVTLAYEQRWFR